MLLKLKKEKTVTYKKTLKTTIFDDLFFMHDVGNYFKYFCII